MRLNDIVNSKVDLRSTLVKYNNAITGKLFYFSNKCQVKIEATHIQLFSKYQYQRLQPPSWDIDFLELLTSSPCIKTEMLDNRNAVSDADRVLGGEYRLFSDNLKLGDQLPDWHKDYFSGHQIPLLPYPLIKIVGNKGIDIIVPWELSRLQFIPTLIAAYCQTGDESYLRCLVKVVDDWEKKNPYLFGANWKTGMDVAIRALNMAIGFAFMQSHVLADNVHFRQILWAHVLYLAQRDIFRSRPVYNNHHLISCVIFYLILHWFDETELIAIWKKRVFLIIQRQIVRQFRADGGNFESAVAYHQLSLEVVLLLLAVLPEEKKSVWSMLGDEAQQRISNAVELVSDYQETWHGQPRIGDSSDGRILFLNDYFNWLPGNGGYLMRLFSHVSCEENNTTTEKAKHGCMYYPQTGVGLYRGKSFGLIVSAMPVEQEVGGHNHLDKGSVLLRVGTHPVFVDPGTFCYTPDLQQRNQFRSTRYHNVVMVDDQEQVAIDLRGAFSVPDGDCFDFTFKKNGIGRVFRFRNFFSKRSSKLKCHMRYVACHEYGFEIVDKFEGEGLSYIEIFFHLDPGLSILRQRKNLSIVRDSEIICFLTLPPLMNIKEDIYWFSPSYNSKIEGVCLILSARIELPFNSVIVVNVPLCTELLKKKL